MYMVYFFILILLLNPIKIFGNISNYNRQLAASDYFSETYKYTLSSSTNTADNIRSVYSIDLDGDGYIDILSASKNTDEIAWWKNNGSESFTKYTITTNALHARCVFAIDMDGDGDIDILSASSFDDTISVNAEYLTLSLYLSVVKSG